jgi:putative ABC transport system permease protein
MNRLTLRLMRTRLGAYVASGLVVLAGTALLTGFAGLFDAGVRAGSQGVTLRLLPIILGSWAAAIVAFAIGSTTSLVLGQREREYALLRSIGAEPAHVRRLILGQTLLTSAPAIVLGLIPGVMLGQVVLDRLIASGVAPAGTQVQAGLLTLGVGAAVTFAAAVLAGLVAGRATTRISPVRALAALHQQPAAGSRRSRRIVALLLLGAGMSSGLTALMLTDPSAQVASAGPACVLASVGLALLAPTFAPAWGRAAARVLGPAGRLAGHNLSSRVGGATAPIVVLVAVATGTLTMQSTEDRVHAGQPSTDDTAATVASANYLVVAMVVAFTVIAVVTTLTAVIRDRRREFGLLRVITATPRQVLGMVSIEMVLTAALGIVLGTAAALTTIVPYSLVKLGTPIPPGPPLTYLTIVAGALGVSLLATLPGTARALRTSAITALTS